MSRPSHSLDPAFVAAFRAGTVTRAQVEAALPADRGSTIFLFLQLSAALASPAPAHHPPGSVPPYAKPQSPPRRKPKGGQPGHRGTARPRPDDIDHRVEHELPVRPDCGGGLPRTGRTRTRIIEDLPDNLKSEVTEHTLHRDWCPRCKKQVE